ncbi:MAG: metallophosphoesterase [Acidimicrobiia bacterium]|nr:MAG: metallophosphoesterase [Acidimicrobiia bacterium]
MLLVADVHGAVDALTRVASRGEPLLVLGDLINFIDYRTRSGIIADVSGHDLAERFVALRAERRTEEATAMWREHARGRENELRLQYDEAIAAAYREICAALDGAEAYVTYGNVDRPDMLADHLPASARFVDAEIIDIEGLAVGFAGGGNVRIGTPGEVTEDEMAEKLAGLGPVDVLCTHVPPAIPALASDVIGGTEKGSQAILDYVKTHQPPFHYFGDIHQPRATTWRIGSTVSSNLGYFRATGRATRHG